LTKKPVHLAETFGQADRFTPSQAENIRFIEMPSMRIEVVSINENEERVKLVGFSPKCPIFRKLTISHTDPDVNTAMPQNTLDGFLEAHDPHKCRPRA